jgi:zinc and cadmium transporter
MSRTLAIAVALAFDAAAGLAGGLLSDRWLHRHLGPLVGFAAGALLAVAFLDLLPAAAAELGGAGFALALGSFAASALLSWHAHPAHGPAEVAGPAPLALLASDALHNMGDGAAVAAAFLASPKAGIAAAAAVVFHELPQELGDFALLRASGLGRGRALLALFAVQLTAYLGAALVLLAAQRAAHVTGIAVALAAGTFLHIGATDLLPELARGQPAERRGRRAGFLLGLGVVAALSVALR